MYILVVDDDLFAEVPINFGHRNKRYQTRKAGRISTCIVFLSPRMPNAFGFGLYQTIVCA